MCYNAYYKSYALLSMRMEATMIVLQKKPNKDFVVLNLTDPQLGTPEWEEGHFIHLALPQTSTQQRQQRRKNSILQDLHPPPILSQDRA